MADSTGSFPEPCSTLKLPHLLSIPIIYQELCSFLSYADYRSVACTPALNSTGPLPYLLFPPTYNLPFHQDGALSFAQAFQPTPAVFLLNHGLLPVPELTPAQASCASMKMFKAIIANALRGEYTPCMVPERLQAYVQFQRGSTAAKLALPMEAAIALQQHAWPAGDHPGLRPYTRQSEPDFMASDGFAHALWHMAGHWLGLSCCDPSTTAWAAPLLNAACARWPHSAVALYLEGKDWQTQVGLLAQPSMVRFCALKGGTGFSQLASAGLHHIRELVLHGCSAADVSDLSGLVHLQSLTMSECSSLHNFPTLPLACKCVDIHASPGVEPLPLGTTFTGGVCAAVAAAGLTETAGAASVNTLDCSRLAHVHSFSISMWSQPYVLSHIHCMSRLQGLTLGGCCLNEAIGMLPQLVAIRFASVMLLEKCLFFDMPSISLVELDRQDALPPAFWKHCGVCLPQQWRVQGALPSAVPAALPGITTVSTLYVTKCAFADSMHALIAALGPAQLYLDQVGDSEELTVAHAAWGRVIAASLHACDVGVVEFAMRSLVQCSALRITACPSLHILPDCTSMRAQLLRMDIIDCPRLHCIRTLGVTAGVLHMLRLVGCPELSELPAPAGASAAGPARRDDACAGPGTEDDAWSNLFFLTCQDCSLRGIDLHEFPDLSCLELIHWQDLAHVGASGTPGGSSGQAAALPEHLAPGDFTDLPWLEVLNMIGESSMELNLQHCTELHGICVATRPGAVVHLPPHMRCAPGLSGTDAGCPVVWTTVEQPGASHLLPASYATVPCTVDSSQLGKAVDARDGHDMEQLIYVLDSNASWDPRPFQKRDLSARFPASWK